MRLNPSRADGSNRTGSRRGRDGYSRRAFTRHPEAFRRRLRCSTGSGDRCVDAGGGARAVVGHRGGAGVARTECDRVSGVADGDGEVGAVRDSHAGDGNPERGVADGDGAPGVLVARSIGVTVSSDSLVT